MKVLPFIGAAAIALALAAPAKAVDVTNEQETEIQLTVSDSVGSEMVNISVQGDQVAVIRGGKISIRTN